MTTPTTSRRVYVARNGGNCNHYYDLTDGPVEVVDAGVDLHGDNDLDSKTGFHLTASGDGTVYVRPVNPEAKMRGGGWMSSAEPQYVHPDDIDVVVDPAPADVPAVDPLGAIARAVDLLGGPSAYLDLDRVAALALLLIDPRFASATPAADAADTTPAAPAWDVSDFSIDPDGRRVRVNDTSEAATSYRATPDLFGKVGTCATDDRASDGSVYVMFADGTDSVYVDYRDLTGIAS